jgi:pyruvate dehydrogenase E1 component beta subunit
VEDLYGLTRSAIEDDNPVLVFEHKNLFSIKGTVDPGAPPVPLGSAAVVRDGADVTVVATQQMRHRGLQAAERLAAEGVDVALIDPRTLVPFDHATVIDSLRRTSRLVVVQEAPEAGSWGASLISKITREHWDLLDAPPVLVATPDTPVPYAGELEAAWLPDAEGIAAEIRKIVAY